MKKNILVAVFSFLVTTLAAFSQGGPDSKQVEKLEADLKNNSDARAKLHKTSYDKSDTARVKILNALSYELVNRQQFDKAQPFLDEALSISKAIGYKAGEGGVYNNTGILNATQGDLPSAMKYFSDALKIASESKNKRVAADEFGNIGNIYTEWGNYPEALKNQLAALKLREELGNKRLTAKSYNSLGILYADLLNNKEALKNYSSAIEIQKQLGDQRGLMYSYSNYGHLLSNEGDYTEALKYYLLASKISEEIEDLEQNASALLDIGTVYSDQGNYTDANKYNAKALKEYEEIGDKAGIIECLGNLGEIAGETKDYNGANKYLDSALILSKEIGANSLTRDIYKKLSALDSLRGNWQAAYQYHKQYILYRDSLINEENDKKLVQAQMQYDFDKKEAIEKAEEEKKDLAYQKELALKALQYEYQKKQAAAKSDAEKQQLKYEQQLKEQQINYEYTQKITKVETEKKQQAALNTMLSAENNLIAQNSKNKTTILWLMVAALGGFVAFGVNYYRSYKRQQAYNIKIVKQSEQLQVLNREVHHRVKNNLQVIVSMLRLQARTVNDKTIIDALSVAENRLQTIAMVHEKLYKSENITSVVLKEYLNELMELLMKQFESSAPNIKFNITDKTNLTTNLDTAIPLGLIVNELVTNAFTHAFPAAKNSEVQLVIEKADDKQYQLTVKDNGVGMPGGKLPENSSRLGLRLVKLFAEQLNGTIRYISDGGSLFVINFLPVATN